MARPSVDLPQPDSPTMPRVSPGLRSNEMPSTALTAPLAPASSPFPIGKWTFRSRTLSKASVIVAPLGCHEMASGGTPACPALQRGGVRRAALDAPVATRRERTAAHLACQRARAAGNGAQIVGGVVIQARRRRHQPLRIGMTRRLEQRVDRRLLH